MTKLVRKLWVGIGVVSMAGVCAEALAQHGGHDATPASSGKTIAPARIGEGVSPILQTVVRPILAFACCAIWR